MIAIKLTSKQYNDLHDEFIRRGFQHCFHQYFRVGETVLTCDDFQVFRGWMVAAIVKVLFDTPAIGDNDIADSNKGT